MQVIDGAFGEESYRYDGRGNLREAFRNGKKKFYYEYDGLNRMSCAFNYDEQLGANYDYNGLGHRIGKRFGEPTNPVTPQTPIDEIELRLHTHYFDVLDLSKQYHNLLVRTTSKYQGDESETQWKNDRMKFVYDFGVLSAHESGEKPMFNDLYYLQDDLGSPVRVMSSRKHMNAFGYDEFGEVTSKLDRPMLPIIQPFTFTGYQKDEVSNTYFAQAREYQPTVGRFLVEDLVEGKLSIPDTFNQYVYCWNNPMNLVDLDGLLPSDEIQAQQDSESGVNRNPNPISLSNSYTPAGVCLPEAETTFEEELYGAVGAWMTIDGPGEFFISMSERTSWGRTTVNPTARYLGHAFRAVGILLLVHGWLSDYQDARCEGMTNMEAEAQATAGALFSGGGAALGALGLSWFPGGKIIGGILGGLLAPKILDEV